MVETVRFTCFTKFWVGQVACALQLTGSSPLTDCRTGHQVVLHFSLITITSIALPVPMHSPSVVTQLDLGVN